MARKPYVAKGESPETLAAQIEANVQKAIEALVSAGFSTSDLQINAPAGDIGTMMIEIVMQQFAPAELRIADAE